MAVNGSHYPYEWAKNDAMSARRRNRLHDMTIDEVSLVDRAANQLATIAFSKADNQEDEMPGEIEVFDVDGFPVGMEDVEYGDVVYDADGEEFVVVDPSDEAEYEEFDEFEPVGKSARSRAARKGNAGLRRYMHFREGYDIGREGTKGAEGGVRFQPLPARYKNGKLKNRDEAAGMYVGRHRNAILGGAGAATLTGAGGAAAYHERDRFRKSLGDAVLEELSKAASEDERSEIIASAMEEVEVAKAAAAEAIEYAEAARDEQVTMAFISKAAEYNLPVSPEVLGPILKSVTMVLDPEQVEVLDQLFTGIGEYLYDELGVVGDTDNVDVMGMVDEYANELVGKADGQISPEMATTLMFENNPAAYEQYLAENGR